LQTKGEEPFPKKKIYSAKPKKSRSRRPEVAPVQPAMQIAVPRTEELEGKTVFVVEITDGGEYLRVNAAAKSP
jgi:hypothetical protein